MIKIQKINYLLLISLMGVFFIFLVSLILLENTGAKQVSDPKSKEVNTSPVSNEKLDSTMRPYEVEAVKGIEDSNIEEESIQEQTETSGEQIETYVYVTSREDSEE